MLQWQHRTTMGFDPNGSRRALTPIDQYAVVVYIPQPLGSILDRLRQALVLGCRHRAHVSVLPPRNIELVDWRATAEEVRQPAGESEPFEIELGEIAVFAETKVVYLELLRGSEELHALHARLNTNDLACRERFDFHPHITLAQDFDQAELDAVCRQARAAWRDSPHLRTFRAEKLHFVRNTLENVWLDLCEMPLGAMALR